MKGNSASLAHDLCVLSSQTCAASASKCGDESTSCLYRYLRRFIKSFYFRNGSTIGFLKEFWLLLCGGYVRELAAASYPHIHGSGGFPQTQVS